MNSVGQLQLALQVLQEVQGLRPDRNVERRDRLVGDHEPGPGREGARDPDALALAAAERVRIAPHVFGPQADPFEHVGDAVFELPAPREAIHQQRLADDLQEGHPGVQGGIRVLEDHLHVAPQRLHPPVVDPCHVDDVVRRAGKKDLAARRLDPAEHAAARGRLAAAAFAHEAEGLALGDGEAHVVDGLDRPDGPPEKPAAHRKVLAEAPDLQERRVATRAAHGDPP